MKQRNIFIVHLLCLLFMFFMGNGTIIAQAPIKKPTRPQKEQPAQVDPTKQINITQLSFSGRINGHDYVDLGLSVKWATCNVGASKPEGYGDYFAWGEIKPKSSYDQDNSVTYKKEFGSIAGNSRYDAARANLGGSWRLPTRNEIEELIKNCTTEWTTLNSVRGYLMTSKKNGNSIFLPAAGFRMFGPDTHCMNLSGSYWSATPDPNVIGIAFGDAYGLSFSSFNSFNVHSSHRFAGKSIRPVSK